MAKLKLNAWGKEHQITFRIDHYVKNVNLAIEMICWDDGFPEPWSMLTVNLDEKCEPCCAFIDTNNNGLHIIDWLVQNKLGTPTGRYEVSGFCVYPEFEFNLCEVDKYVEAI